MTKSDVARAQRISYEGRDCDCLLFSSESWTRPDSGIVHHITADFASGTITCNCEDGRMHHKIIDIITGSGTSCKHLACVSQLVRKILESGGMK